jgi:hypothetical protein
MIAPVVRAFAEMSLDSYAIADKHCSFFTDKPKAC